MAFAIFAVDTLAATPLRLPPGMIRHLRHCSLRATPYCFYDAIIIAYYACCRYFFFDVSPFRHCFTPCRYSPLLFDDAAHYDYCRRYYLILRFRYCRFQHLPPRFHLLFRH